jgi:hypothetical protein
MCESIDDKVIESVKKRGRGTVFSSSEYSHLGEPDSVQKALSRLVDNGKLLHICHGIYCYPKVDKELGLGMLYPSYDDIANAIARRDRIRIFPGAALAQNILGLSTQVPLNYVYLTDGAGRKVMVDDGRGILFKHVSPRKLAFSDRLAMLIATALREIGSEDVTAEQRDRIKRILVENHPQAFSSGDMKLMPLWIRKIVESAYE